MLQQPSYDPDCDNKGNQTNSAEMRMHPSNNPDIITNIPYHNFKTDITAQSLSRQHSNPLNIQNITTPTNATNENETDISLSKEDIDELNFYFTDEITPQDIQLNEDEMAHFSQYVISEICKDKNTAFIFNYNDINSPSTKRTKKRKNKNRKKPRKNSKSDGIGYAPNTLRRAQGNIQISKSLTENIIPSRIKEHISNIYTFMDKSYCLSLQNKNTTKNDRLQAINYGFHDKTSNEILYCVILKQDISCNKSRGYKWKMLNKLFTAKELESEYEITADLLPMSWRNAKECHNEIGCGYNGMILKVLQNNLADIINECQWHKINIFNRVNNKRRMTLSLTKPEIIRQLSLYCGRRNDINLVPILMFNCLLNEYWIEHVWIIAIDANISIGIAFVYNKDNTVKVNGIHLDKQYLMDQHQLLLTHQQQSCHCFNAFHSNISDLKIGNPDDLQNKINYYKQVIQELTQYKENMESFVNRMARNSNKYVESQQITMANTTNLISANQAVVTNNNYNLSLVQSPRYQHINYNNNNNASYGISPSYTINASQYPI